MRIRCLRSASALAAMRPRASRLLSNASLGMRRAGFASMMVSDTMPAPPAGARRPEAQKMPQLAAARLRARPWRAPTMRQRVASPGRQAAPRRRGSVGAAAAGALRRELHGAARGATFRDGHGARRAREPPAALFDTCRRARRDGGSFPRADAPAACDRRTEPRSGSDSEPNDAAASFRPHRGSAAGDGACAATGSADRRAARSACAGCDRRPPDDAHVAWSRAAQRPRSDASRSSGGLAFHTGGSRPHARSFHPAIARGARCAGGPAETARSPEPVRRADLGARDRVRTRRHGPFPW